MVEDNMWTWTLTLLSLNDVSSAIFV